MRTEKQTVYIAEDGTRFVSELQCIQYEEQTAEVDRRLNGLSVYKVRHNFDTTEGRGFADTIYVLTDVTHAELMQWCLNNFGQPLRKWHRTSYYESWTITVVEMLPREAIAMNGKPVRSIGDIMTKATTVFVSRKDLEGVEGLPERQFPEVLR